jgi:hypothetical protein
VALSLYISGKTWFCMICLHLWKNYNSFTLLMIFLFYIYTEMRYCEISKEMSSLCFVLVIFCLFEAGVPEFDMQPLPPSSCGLYRVHCTRNTASNSWTLASNWRHLCADLQYLISDTYAYAETIERWSQKRAAKLNRPTRAPHPIKPLGRKTNLSKWKVRERDAARLGV